ncbi:hypothetical protein AVEN_105053-1 [Araneus ventricosus]|uniref:Endonuclease/exonuclease/phosphatase domain-containing protein n=1 Tax=Araneus ventricosus TaxID=182803 RepID=A0A4Y2RLE7_ARAVE|nr:hypothetical protein AVEN_105053-1 [Araneus ventricosus]
MASQSFTQFGQASPLTSTLIELSLTSSSNQKILQINLGQKSKQLRDIHENNRHFKSDFILVQEPHIHDNKIQAFHKTGTSFHQQTKKQQFSHPGKTTLQLSSTSQKMQ